MRGRAVGCRPEVWCLAGGLVLAVLGGSVLPLVLGGVAAPVLARAWRVRALGRVAQERGDAVIALCGAVIAEVRAGCQPAEALLTAARETGGVGGGEGSVLAAARFGGDVPAALRDAAKEPGAQGLLGLAACWSVAVERGAGLDRGLARLEGALRADRDQQADLHAQLAGARATAVLLAGLPVVGLLMGAALGASPLRVLLHTGVGLGCLAVGVVLEGVGLWWAAWIVRRAEA
nr:type II secretion system F family protein [Streptomyces sp. YIM 130001]